MRLRLVIPLVAAFAAAASAETIRFDGPSGATAGWTFSMTHDGGPPRWQVLSDNTAPSPPGVLAQLSDDATASRFPLAVYDRFAAADGAVSVKFKAVSGKADRTAGLVWRFRDPDNYYIARANALENNVVLYKIENGKRTAIAPLGTPPGTYGMEHVVPPGTWCELAVRFRGDLITVTFNGEKLFEARDSTFRGSGKTGLWTKADSITYFDDFSFAEGRRAPAGD